MPRQTKAKTISAAKHLEAFALFTMARQHQEKANEFFKALKASLGRENAEHLSDAMWGDMGTFDEALAREGFVVKAAPKKRSR